MKHLISYIIINIFIPVFACLSSQAIASEVKFLKLSKELQSNFPGCEWKNLRNTSLSIWSFDCSKSQNPTRLLSDEKLPGFIIETQYGDRIDKQIAIHLFSKEQNADIKTIIPAIRGASPGKFTSTCTLVQQKSDPTRYIFEPTGQAKKKWQDSEMNGGDLDQPCGVYGVDYVGDRYFKIMEQDSTKVIFYNMGSEIQIFAPETPEIISK